MNKEEKTVSNQCLPTSNISEAETRATLEKEKQERVKRCSNKISAILEEENCALDISMVINQKGNFPQLVVVSK